MRVVNNSIAMISSKYMAHSCLHITCGEFQQLLIFFFSWNILYFENNVLKVSILAIERHTAIVRQVLFTDASLSSLPVLFEHLNQNREPWIQSNKNFMEILCTLCVTWTVTSYLGQDITFARDLNRGTSCINGTELSIVWDLYSCLFYWHGNENIFPITPEH